MLLYRSNKYLQYYFEFLISIKLYSDIFTESLNLAKNKIEEISSVFFAENHQLKVLNMSANIIKELSSDTFQGRNYFFKKLFNKKNNTLQILYNINRLLVILFNIIIWRMTDSISTVYSVSFR